MFILIVFILIIGFIVYYLTTINFEIGDGFTEMKKDIRDVDYKIVDKQKDKKLLK